MLVTELRPSRHGRLLIYDDGGYVATADAETLSRHGVHVGSELSGPELEALAAESAERRAKEKALRLLAV
ncbi:MAG: regulatory protein RecX, partial [Clostridia bacterium]|nr:regulatory protein RecX [Clostridia bacterium]